MEFRWPVIEVALKTLARANLKIAHSRFRTKIEEGIKSINNYIEQSN